MADWLPPDQWYASLPKVIAGVGALITDPDSRVLLVDPKCRPEWTFPGGSMDVGEFPHQTCARELKEELGLDIEVGTLLVADWVMPAGHRTVPMAYYVFDCGQIEDLSGVRLQDDELDDARFFDLNTAMRKVALHVAPRLEAAVAARQDGRSVYLPNTTGHQK